MNDDGHASGTGLAGDKDDSDFISALATAHNKKQLNDALAGLEQSAAAGKPIDKAELVMAGMKKKKRPRFSGILM